MSIARIDFDRLVARTDTGEELTILSCHNLAGEEVEPTDAHWLKVADEDGGEALIDISHLEGFRQ